MMRADEQYDIRLEVEKVLYALGDTVQQVMETLINKGISLDRCCRSLWNKGHTYDEMLENNVYEDRHSADNCPVHDYLKQEFPELIRITAGTEVTQLSVSQTSLLVGADTVFIQNPPAVSMFIQMYDNHSLGALEDA